jgi:hypothetical protein
MQRSAKVLIPCAIERGGFGNERTYRIPIAGDGEHIGVAPWIYCFDKDRQPVEVEPSIDQTIDGFVVGKVVRNGGQIAKVAFPDGEVCLIDANRIVEDLETVNRVLV